MQIRSGLSDVDRFEYLVPAIGRGTENDLYRLAYEEFRVAQQFSTGNGEAYVATWNVPSWFWRCELGYGVNEGPCLEETLRTLRETNAKRRKLFEASEIPLKPRPRPRKQKRRKSGLSKELRAVLAEAGLGAGALLAS